jgi:hypothetical protein
LQVENFGVQVENLTPALKPVLKSISGWELVNSCVNRLLIGKIETCLFYVE